MCELGEALEKTEYTVFLAAGIRVNEQNIPHMRLAGDANIVRKMSDEAWGVMRTTLIQSVDKMRSAPLDDLTHV